MEHERLTDPDYNDKLITTVCIPTVVMIQQLQGGGLSDYERAYPYRLELGRAMYNGIRNKWPQVNERTNIVEFNYNQVQVDNTPRPTLVTPAELLPGIMPAIYRALRGSRLMRRLCESRFNRIKNRANRLAFTLMVAGWTVRASIPMNVETYHMERVDTGIEGYFGNGVRNLVLPFRGTYIPRTDTLYYHRLWKSSDVYERPPANGMGATWYTAPNYRHESSPDIVAADQAFMDSLDGAVKKFQLQNTPLSELSLTYPSPAAPADEPTDPDNLFDEDKGNE